MAKVAEFLVEEDDGSLAVTNEPEQQPKVVVSEEPTVVTPTTKSARVKGTWTMVWGLQKFDFVDGRRYEIPMDLFEYLKSRGNIYDTL